MLALPDAVPIYGAAAWRWQSFDLTILYWLGKLVIYVLMVERMSIRHCSHLIELVFPSFLVCRNLYSPCEIKAISTSCALQPESSTPLQASSAYAIQGLRRADDV